eukprot:2431390-Rhodomonas_salina.2
MGPIGPERACWTRPQTSLAESVTLIPDRVVQAGGSCAGGSSWPLRTVRNAAGGGKEEGGGEAKDERGERGTEQKLDFGVR